MEQKLKEQISLAVNEWIDSNNSERSGQKLSDKASINISYVSNIKNGNYFVGATPIQDKYFIKLADILGISIGDTEIHWETENFKTVQNLCKSAQNKRKIVLLDSEDSGLGKTYGLEYYATYNDKVIYVKCTSSMGAKDLLNEILYKLGVKEVPKSPKAKLDMIREKVLGSPGYLIIIDEAEDIKSGLYKIIKEIIDFTYLRCAMIISGMGLIEKIGRLANKQRVGFPQLKRRLFSNRAMLRRIGKQEIADICEKHGIANRSAIQWFQRQISDYQMFSEYIKDTVIYMQKHSETIDDQLLIQLFQIV